MSRGKIKTNEHERLFFHYCISCSVSLNCEGNAAWRGQNRKRIRKNLSKKKRKKRQEKGRESFLVHGTKWKRKNWIKNEWEKGWACVGRERSVKMGVAKIKNKIKNKREDKETGYETVVCSTRLLWPKHCTAIVVVFITTIETGIVTVFVNMAIYSWHFIEFIINLTKFTPKKITIINFSQYCISEKLYIMIYIFLIFYYIIYILENIIVFQLKKKVISLFN